MANNGVFKPIIYERGEQIYRQNKVHNIKKMDEKTYIGNVRGTYDYRVQVNINNKMVYFAHCDCPYAKEGNYCKHEAALYIAVKKAYLNMGEGYDNLNELLKNTRTINRNNAIKEYFISKKNYYMALLEKGYSKKISTDLKGFLDDYIYSSLQEFYYSNFDQDVFDIIEMVINADKRYLTDLQGNLKNILLGNHKSLCDLLLDFILESDPLTYEKLIISSLNSRPIFYNNYIYHLIHAIMKKKIVKLDNVLSSLNNRILGDEIYNMMVGLDLYVKNQIKEAICYLEEYKDGRRIQNHKLYDEVLDCVYESTNDYELIEKRILGIMKSKYRERLNYASKLKKRYKEQWDDLKYGFYEKLCEFITKNSVLDICFSLDDIDVIACYVLADITLYQRKYDDALFKYNKEVYLQILYQWLICYHQLCRDYELRDIIQLLNYFYRQTQSKAMVEEIIYQILNQEELNDHYIEWLEEYIDQLQEVER